MRCEQERTATECLEAAIHALPQRSAPFAVLRIGLDKFRAVNEGLGFAAGDRVLAMAEQRLVTGIREYEVVVRLPGDEFAVLLHSVSTVIRAGLAADRLSGLLHQMFQLQDGPTANVSACIGLALAPEDGTRAELLLHRAGLALRFAKAAGSGTVQFFDPAMEGHRRKRPDAERVHPTPMWLYADRALSQTTL